jgi:hypothetical protein
MTVTLNKRLILKSALAYLEIEKETERKDIQDYLLGKNKFHNLIVEVRVKKYLREIKIYDDNYHLTPYGNKAAETGMVKTNEEGKYKIWFTQNDSHFGNKIIFLKRQEPMSQLPQFKTLAIDGNRGHFCLKSDNDDFYCFELKNTSLVWAEEQNACSLPFSWKWNELESSVYSFTGKIENNNIVPQEIAGDVDLNAKITEILPEWDSVHNRYRIRFNDVNDNDRLLFECSYKSRWKDFDVHINNLRIEPYNDNEERIWRNHLLNIELSKGYIHPIDFESIVGNLNREPAFRVYSNSLDLPSAENYRKEINPSNASDRDAVFWHLSAPMDLNPQFMKEEIKNV